MNLVHGFIGTFALFFGGMLFLCKLTGYQSEDIRFSFRILFAAAAAEVLILTAGMILQGD